MITNLLIGYMILLTVGSLIVIGVHAPEVIGDGLGAMLYVVFNGVQGALLFGVILKLIKLRNLEKAL